MAYETIRKMIVLGHLSEDKPWSIRTLAKRFNLSVVPVYGAIRKLEQEGIVIVHPKSGIRIRQLSPREISDAFVVREGLEIQAIRLLAKHAAPDIVANLKKKAQDISRLIHLKKFQEAAIADFEWHFFLIQSAGCTMLTNIYEQLSTICLLTFKSSDGAWLELQQERVFALHMKLINAIASGNPDKAEKAVRGHVRSSASF